MEKAGPHKIVAAFDIVTPMFIAGADNGPDAEPKLRVSGIIGALRFWWRALAWSRVEALPPEAGLTVLLAWESALFGSAENGQGAFLLRLSLPDNTLKSTRTQRQPQANAPLGGYPRISPREERHWADSGSGLAYLAGQGLTRNVKIRRESGRDFNQFVDARRAILPDQRFELVLIPKPYRVPSESGTLVRWRRIDKPVLPLFGPGAAGEPPTLLDALQAFGMMGGLGSRSRRGYGSVALRDIGAEGEDEPLWSSPTSPKSLKAQVDALLNRFRGAARPPYSGIGPDAMAAFRADPIKSRAELKGAVQRLHNRVGHEFQRYRAWGFRGYVGGENALRLFGDDHSWFKAISAEGARRPKDVGWREYGPERAVLGLPHNYQSNDGTIVKVEPAKGQNSQVGDRRASPLFLHLHSFPNAAPCAIWLLLPSEFLPGREGLSITAQRRRERGQETWKVGNWRPDYSVASDFFRPVRKT